MVTHYSKTQKYIWIKSDGKKPDPYVLVELALENGRSLPGWWNGTAWCGRRLKHDDVVSAFKIKEFHERA